MERLRSILLLAALSLLMGQAGPPAEPVGPIEPVEAQPSETRVIVRINRNQEVAGWVVFEDLDLIIVRDRRSRIQSFSKARVQKIITLVEPAPGQPGVVFMRDGQQREGVVLEDGFDAVVLDIDGIEARLLRNTVEYVILEPTFEQRYARYKEAVGDNLPLQHFELCRWLVGQRRYEVARLELEDLLKREPLPEAERLLTVVEAQLALRETPAVDEDDHDPLVVPRPDMLPDRILSHADVNLIRVYEIDFDEPPKVSISADTIRALIDTYAANRLIPTSEARRRALFSADPLEVVELVFRLRARELYPKIQVITEPWALNQFRRRVHNTWLLNSCATSRCHGGGEGGRFFLYRKHHKDERVRYTNLLILHQLELDGQWPLVNYDEPILSLIIQHGLPRDRARKPHPNVRGWKPVFGPSGQRMLKDTIRWIESMMQPRPDYPVEFELPTDEERRRLPPPPGRDIDRAPR